MACEWNASEELATTDDSPSSLLVLVLLSGCLLVVFAAASNCFVVYAIVTKRSLRKRSNALYVSLAVADILVATCVMTLALANDLLDRWLLGAFMCRFWTALDVMCCTASILSIAAVSFDRYLHISDPFVYERVVTKRLMCVAICLIWLLSAAISFIPIGLGYHERHIDSLHSVAFENQSLAKHCQPTASGSHQCKFEINFAYAVLSSLISFYVPCAVVLVVYAKLYRIARYHYSKISHSLLTQQLVSKTVVAMGAFAPPVQPASGPKKSLSTTALNVPNDSFRAQLQAERKCKKLFKEKKAAITLGLIISTFLVTWAPYFIVNIIGAVDSSIIPHQLFVAFTYMGYMNSCIDPIVYVVFHADFRVALRTTVQRCRALLSNGLCGRLWPKLRTPQPSTCTGSQPAELMCASLDFRSTCDADDELASSFGPLGRRPQARRKSKSFANLYFAELHRNV